MKKCLSLFLIVLLVISCTPEYVSIRTEKRIEISGKILNYNSSDAVPQIPVATYGILGERLITTDDHKLGSGITSAAGNFRFISLDIRNGQFALSLNPLYENLHNDDYATYHFVSAEDGPGTVVAAGNIELPRVMEFNFSIQNTSGTQEDLRYTIIYSNKELFYLLQDSEISLEVPEYYQWYNYSQYSGVHDYAQETRRYPIETIEGSELVINYSLGDEEPQELIIPVTSQMSDYVFEY